LLNKETKKVTITASPLSEVEMIYEELDDDDDGNADQS
jgi:hypothetical protein